MGCLFLVIAAIAPVSAKRAIIEVESRQEGYATAIKNVTAERDDKHGMFYCFPCLTYCLLCRRSRVCSQMEFLDLESRYGNVNGAISTTPWQVDSGLMAKTVQKVLQRPKVGMASFTFMFYTGARTAILITKTV